MEVEEHPLPLFLPGNAQILMLGSFPPQRVRWSMDFYYPNWQNDMWRIFGLVFFDDKDYFVLPTEKKFDKARIVCFLKEKGIALGDTARSVVRLKNNASDAYLQVVEPLCLESVITQLPQCKAIVVTGQKAADTLCAMTGAASPEVGRFVTVSINERALRIYRMPSSSRAYPKPLIEKAAIYNRMFAEINLL